MSAVREDEDRPRWAHRMREERIARGWSQPDAIRELRKATTKPLPSEAAVLRNWKRWESGEVEPDGFYKPLIARAFGTVTGAFFPPKGDAINAAVMSGTGMETLEILSRIRASDASVGTLDSLQIAVDRLCCDYPNVGSVELRQEGHAWLQRITTLLNGRLTLAQHQEVLNLAGWLALLVGCVEYDMGDRRSAEATRRAAFALGEEAGNSAIIGWAYEMRAWYALTQGDYRGVIAAAEAGEVAARGQSVAVQLAAQRAKAWARMGDAREVTRALDQGRTLLEGFPYPDDPDHHFVVDPAKFDFYAMDCYRIAGDNKLAEVYATEVIRAGTDEDGHERRPMRIAEARVTLGVIAARSGEVEKALTFGREAVAGDRKSLPSLLMCSRELSSELSSRNGELPEVRDYLDQLRSLRTA